MKQHKLLKDLPFAKAGTIFERHPEEPVLIYKNYRIHLLDINADDWFEEIKEEEFSERIFYILAAGGVDSIETVNYSNTKDNRKEYKEYKGKPKSVGNCFETREEAEKYLEYLKAKEVIKQDTKGFKPDWTDKKTRKYYGYWDFERGFKNYFEGGKPSWDSLQTTKESNIYFESWEDIEESFEKHPDEWRTYLTYEQ